MARSGVRHPVVVDRDRAIWQSYTIRSWPTVVVIRPDGTIAAIAPGECDLDPLDEFVGRLLDEARAAGTLAREPFRTEAPPVESPGILAFPGKVLSLGAGRLAVADSGHHRVLVTGADGRVERVIGSGTPGLHDGPNTEAALRQPQGLAYHARPDLPVVGGTGHHPLRG